jgi:hypothetical protein
MRIRAAFELIGVWGADAEPREHGNVSHRKECMRRIIGITASNLGLELNPAYIEHPIL